MIKDVCVVSRTSKTISADTECAKRCCGKPCECDPDLLDGYEVVQRERFVVDFPQDDPQDGLDGPFYPQLINGMDFVNWEAPYSPINEIDWSQFQWDTHRRLYTWHYAWPDQATNEGAYYPYIASGDYLLCISNDKTYWNLSVSISMRRASGSQHAYSKKFVKKLEICNPEFGIPIEQVIDKWDEITVTKGASWPDEQDDFNVDAVAKVSITHNLNPLP
jgi:hypothetical protein